MSSSQSLDSFFSPPTTFGSPPTNSDPHADDHLHGSPGIASAVPYVITEVAGQDAVAASNADFVGEVSFLIDIEGQPCQIDGVGALDGIGVRLNQKDEGHNGRDVRVWQICGVPGTGFMAEHTAAI